MAKRFNLVVPYEDIDMEVVYADSVVVDAAGIDLYIEDKADMSVSLSGVDRFDMAYRVLGDETYDYPDAPEFWIAYNDFIEETDIYLDKYLEYLAHAALKALADRKCDAD